MQAHALRTLAAASALAAALAGCSSNPSSPGLFDRAVGKNHVQGDASGVTVTGLGSVPEAFPLAIGLCSRFGKSAQYARKAGDAFVFRCVQS